MQVTIDNQDGKGPIDYSQAVCSGADYKDTVYIQRALNAPTLARLQLDCASHGLPVPAINAWIVISAENGTVLFTGYSSTDPEPVFAGYSSEGPQYLLILNVFSEDWLLNREALPQTAPLMGQTAGNIVRTLTNRVNPSLVQMNGLEDIGTVGFFEPMPNRPWSENVAALANQARSAYRVLNGQLTLAPVGSTVHALNSAIGKLTYAAVDANHAKQLVNDVILTGHDEPMEYVTELFKGDGVTDLFQLQREPLRTTRPTLLDEQFTNPTLNPAIWQINDAGGYFNISGDGLAVTGGAGVDGTTTLVALDPVELGGEVIFESGFVQLNAGSDGVVCGIYSGTIEIGNCVAGFRVRSSGSNTIVIPLVNGNELGTAFTIQSGHRYILRMRLHSTELQRVLNSYFVYGANGPEVFGGGTIASPLHLLFEVQDMALLPYVNIGSTILYDGEIATSPAIANFACINSKNINGSFGYFKVTQPGTVWIVSAPSNGAAFTRRIGQANQGADCNILRNGFIHFYKLAIPQPGEIVAVSYRVAAASVARFATSSGGGEVPEVSQWVGHIEHPPARNSIDCENACQAVLSFAGNQAALWAGKYNFYNLQNQQDIWPGDALQFSAAANGMNENVIVRSVVIRGTSSFPEVLDYSIEFANEWADALAIETSHAVSPTVNLPLIPQTTAGTYLENLNALSVISISTTAIQVNAGTTAPPNGGFEVRSRDYSFGANGQESLVLRSPTANFSITRSADEEQFYIRMYDGSNPPLYSRTSSAIFTNIATS